MTASRDIHICNDEKLKMAGYQSIIENGTLLELKLLTEKTNLAKYLNYPNQPDGRTLFTACVAKTSSGNLDYLCNKFSIDTTIRNGRDDGKTALMYILENGSHITNILVLIRNHTTLFCAEDFDYLLKKRYFGLAHCMLFYKKAIASDEQEKLIKQHLDLDNILKQTPDPKEDEKNTHTLMPLASGPAQQAINFKQYNEIPPKKSTPSRWKMFLPACCFTSQEEELTHTNQPSANKKVN